MKRSSWTFGAALLATAAACGPTLPAEDAKPGQDVPQDVTDALHTMPEAQVIEWTTDGLPTFIVGEMAKVDAMQSDDMATADRALQPALVPVLKAFRLTSSDLVARRMNVDDNGDRHFRYAQKHAGLDVIGGDLIVHVDVKGAVYSVNGTARGDIAAELGAHAITESAAKSTILADARFAGLTTTATRLVYIETADGVMHKAYESVVEGTRGQDPKRDKVYVDVDTNQVVADYPQIMFVESRKVYGLAGGTALPGTLKRSEGQAAVSDTDVNAAYDGTGDAYEAYKNFFARDSYNNAGGALISSVHYSTNYCNAYWNGTQMVYGDGDPAQSCAPLARSVDVTAHELTHGVTAAESNLNYSGESGGMNEAMSDIFGAFVEAWTDGGKTGTLTVSNNTWLIGENVIAGGLRFMCNPSQDGASADYYTSTVGNLDVHYSSGLGNLAFCLLSKGGTHPTGKSTTVVPGIGMEKAIRIMYKAQTDYLTSTSKYAQVRTSMEQATTALGYDAATKDAVGCAWAAIGVGTAPASCGGTGGGGGGGTTDVVLTNGVAKTGLAGATGSQTYYSLVVPAGQASLTVTMAGGTGDADMYVQAGTKPTTTTYTCRPYVSGNAENCVITNPAAGTYYVMLNGYAAYTGISLTGKYVPPAGGGGGTTGDPYLTNGTAVTGVAGAASSAQYWRIAVPAGATLSVKTTGSTGDADLYTRQGSRPTTTTYSCRPYQNGSNESCSLPGTAAGDYYVMVRGYTAYSGLSLVASF